MTTPTAQEIEKFTLETKCDGSHVNQVSPMEVCHEVTGDYAGYGSDADFCKTCGVALEDGQVTGEAEGSPATPPTKLPSVEEMEDRSVGPMCTCCGPSATTTEAGCNYHTDQDVEPEE